MKEHYKINEAKSDLSEPAELYPSETHRFIPAMKAYLRVRDLSYEVALKNGWYPTENVKERDPVPRIVIPCTNKYDRPYWQARAMLPHKLRYRSAKGGRFGSIVMVWPFHIVVDPLHPEKRKPAKHKDMPTVLVEGPMDALAAAGLGYFSIATMGALFSSYAIKYIEDHVSIKVPVIVVPDLDCPQFGVETVQKLSAEGHKVLMRLPVGAKDLAGMQRAGRKRLLKI